MINLLNTSLRAVCVVVNYILLEDRNNWVFKGIMSVTATFWRIYCHWLTCFGCSVLSIWCSVCFPPLWNNCRACYKDLHFVELICHCFFCFVFLLCKIVVRVLFVSFEMVCVFFFCCCCCLNCFKCKMTQFRFQEQSEVFSWGQAKNI